MIASPKSLKIALIAIACSVALSSSVYANRKSDFKDKEVKFKSFDFKKDKFEKFDFKSFDFKKDKFEKFDFKNLPKIRKTEYTPKVDYHNYKLPKCDVPNRVPDGGSTLAMLGVALLGMVGLGRRFR